MIDRILIRRCFLIYQLPSAWHRRDNVAFEYKHIVLDQDWVHYFFRNDPARLDAFCKFIAHGFIGIVWHESDEWISYAWMSTPETLGPPHLPRWIKKLPVYWIFYCRTKEQYQGRGLYKASISLLAQWARKKTPQLTSLY